MSIFNIFNSNDKPKENYQVYRYRTKDGLAYFKFSYHKIPEGYEVDIHVQPSYEGKSERLTITHRLPSSRDTKYCICVNQGFEPKTLEYAKHLSTEWAEFTHVYIKTGTTIDRQIEIKYGTF
jgi:hypothetical protein